MQNPWVLMDANPWICWFFFSGKWVSIAGEPMNGDMWAEAKEVLSRFCSQDQSFLGSGVRLLMLLNYLPTAPCTSVIKGQWFMEFSFGLTSWFGVNQPGLIKEILLQHFSLMLSTYRVNIPFHPPLKMVLTVKTLGKGRSPLTRYLLQHWVCSCNGLPLPLSNTLLVLRKLTPAAEISNLPAAY